MYIVAIAWIFVAAMAALGAQSILGGLLSFVGFVLPLFLLLWIVGTPARKRTRQRHSDDTQASEPKE